MGAVAAGRWPRLAVEIGLLPGAGAWSAMKSRYLLFQKTEAVLIEEKAQKLFGLTRLLDQHLEGDYETLLSRASPPPLRREDKIAVLNRALAPFTDFVARAFPGVGVGYYSKDLRAIITYGPSSQFGSKVGIDLGPEHLGWQAMETGKEIVGVGSMVRGEIMNAMRPLIRNGRAIGFVWANETLEDIYAQMQFGARKVFFSPGVEALLGLSGLLLFASRVLLLGKGEPQSRPSQLLRSVEQLDRYLRLFLNSLSLAVVLADDAENVVFVSSGVKDILGEPPERFTGMNVRQMLRELGIDPYLALEDAERGALNRFTNVMLRTRGEERPVTIISTAVEGEDGRGRGHVIILEDLEKAKEQEERLERAERLAALGEIAASIAHEVKNPLTVVKGAISLVPQKLDDPCFLREFSGVVVKELDRVNRTIEALLDFSRYSNPNMTTVEIRKVLDNALDVISAYARVNRVSVEVIDGDGIPPLKGDADHLTQVFLNLFLNAVQAMPEGGTLTVETRYRCGSKYLEVLVKDTGVGIFPEHRDKVFDMFFTTKKGGTGLGLSLVQRIVFEHQGFVEFESEPGKGTTFIIKLPVIEPATEGAQASLPGLG
ncbi:MAG: PAS domain S-box protein [Firmicutes bacterium]|nr:PAS domain S-box protein [Candidatus Fermentithermobacillaceae bacterium]